MSATTIAGRVWLFGDDINTDLILPNRAQYLPVAEQVKFVFVANVGSQSFTELSINSDGSLGSTSNSIQVGSVPRAL